jgi:two-component system chemotaxis response regulator CheY
MKILVVDDSSVMRNRIARIAGARRYEIVGLAKNGLRALELLRTTRPDVVTMDLTMPEMDGVTCTRGIAAAMPSARILVVSALADKATAIEALKAGAMGFLLKPFSDAQLEEALLDLAPESTHG